MKRRRLVLAALAPALLGAVWLGTQGTTSGDGAFAAVGTGGDRVLTPDNAVAALRDVAGGTYKLAPGTYPLLIVVDARADRPIVIESQDPARPAVLEGLALNNVDGVTIRNLVVTGTHETPKSRALVSVHDATNLVIDGLTISGPKGAAAMAQYTGLHIRASDRVRVTRSHFSAFRYGLSFLDTQHLTIEYNEFTGIQTDGIRGGGASDLLIQGNVIGNFRPMPKDHPDGIQLWSKDASEPGRRIVIRDNLIARDGGGPIQGIFIRDNEQQLPFEDLEISGNLIMAGMYHGILVQGTTRATIRDNRVYAYPEMKSWIRVKGGKAVEMHDNFANVYANDPASQIAERRNRTTKPIKGPVDRLVGDWLAAKPALQAQPGPFLATLLPRAPAAAN